MMDAAEGGRQGGWGGDSPPDGLEPGVEQRGEEEDTAERDGSSESGRENVVVCMREEGRDRRSARCSVGEGFVGWWRLTL